MTQTRRMLAAKLSNLQQHVDAQTGISRTKAKAEIAELTKANEILIKITDAKTVKIANLETQVSALEAELKAVKELFPA